MGSIEQRIIGVAIEFGGPQITHGGEVHRVHIAGDHRIHHRSEGSTES